MRAPRFCTSLTTYLTLTSAAIVPACDKAPPTLAASSASAGPITSAPLTATTEGTAAPSSATPELATQETPAEPLLLQELTFTTEVKGKEPIDTLLAAEPGKRVWAHLRLRYRGESRRKVLLEFSVNGAKRTTIDLTVSKSWSYRTWAYNTLQPTDKTGKVSLKVTDDSGALLADTSVPIASRARTKPYVQKAK